MQASTMANTKIIRHHDYELQCSTRALDNGRFAPLLVICKQSWPRRPRTIAVQQEDCPTEDLALLSAHRQGVEWVSNYG
jgi:hypothetical protein